MAGKFFTVLIDNKPTMFEKGRIITIEPYDFGTKIIMEASHLEEEPIVYITSESYDLVMKSYLT
ncbi:hypothetical protein [Pedobacter sp. SYSU D00535]|uniref:hypothetical protein n=1 Tax=Pedobacter sp. SYSU D00535 TaxID=2810308 RepID=UPI001A959501|nr:hypothetical protein [Pedobacter sp. SYSU D00535]